MKKKFLAICIIYSSLCFSQSNDNELDMDPVNTSWLEPHEMHLELKDVLRKVPGASRAGVTITGARFLGINRTNATIFSMLLSIPIILSSLTLSVFDLSNSSINEIHLQQSFFAAIVACITAFLSIHLMMLLIQKTNFNLFIIYRICLGFVLLVFYA